MSHFFKPLVKYSHIREILYRKIATEYKIGSQLPTENELAVEYAVSRETVRQALGYLEEEGLIERRQGRGTFVISLLKAKGRNRLTGSVTGSPDQTVSVVIEKGMTVDPAAARWLGNRTDEVLWVRRLRFLEGRPLVVHDAFLSDDLAPALEISDLTKSSLREELELHIGRKFKEAEHQVDAIAADRAIAALNEIPIGMPILLLKRFYVLRNRKPIALFNSFYRTDRYYYSVTHEGESRASAKR